MSKTKTSKPKDISSLRDSAKDQQELKPDTATMELPDVKDIPGQEHVRPFLPKEMADTTISSADEEGDDILGLDYDDADAAITGQSGLGVRGAARGAGSVGKNAGRNASSDADVSPAERALLASTDSYREGDDYEGFIKAGLDETDEDGTPLNEKGLRRDASGEDLDVPGSELDDQEEEEGDEDEENNSYSLGGDNNEN